MPGQHCAGEVVEAPGAGLAAIALPSALRVVTPVPDNREAVTPRTTHAIGPAMLAHQGEALGVVQKSREVDQIGCSHDDGGSSRKPDGCLCSSYHTRCPAGTLSKPTTPEADKSHLIKLASYAPSARDKSWLQALLATPTTHQALGHPAHDRSGRGHLRAWRHSRPLPELLGCD